jgi:uncharacterized protein (TIGR03663 family)
MTKILSGSPIGKCCVLILAATIVALALRLPRLRQRPMHGDEAVHAIKFGELLEKGVYKYNPYEYHGPTLNYLTLITAKLASAEKLTEIDEFILRIVPVFFGVSLILLLLLVADGLGPGTAVFAAVLTAVSPAMVFYSRYYIHEMLLVCFTFGAIACGYRYTQNKKIIWIILTGIFVGLMHATKETCIIAFGSMLLALSIVLLMQRKKISLTNAIKVIRPLHIISGLIAAIIISALFYSSFLSNPNGILDSFRFFTTYFERASGNTLHIHSWYYYLKMLVFFRFGNGPIWTEAAVVLLAAIGFITLIKGTHLSSFTNIGLLRFIAFYTLIMMIVYSAIPYKTPWCMLSFLHGMILLAGVGAVALVKLMPKVLPRLIVILLLADACAYLLWQAYLNNYIYYSDSRNPYVYAHPTTEVFTVVEKIEQYARIHKDVKDMHIQVICPHKDYWPLPWYLRSFSRVEWREKIDDNIPLAPLIIASDKVEKTLTDKLYSLTPLEERKMYMFMFDEPYYVWLRPQVKLLGFVRKDLWESLRQSPAYTIPSQTEDEK